MTLEELENLVSSAGCELYDTESVSENGRTIYRVYISKDSGITIDDCEKVSKILSPIYDVMPPISGDWILEVSSPGLERKLTKLDHFAKSIGLMVKITTNEGEKIKGEISATSGDEIEIKISDKNTVKIDFANIKKAKTFIEF